MAADPFRRFCRGGTGLIEREIDLSKRETGERHVEIQVNQRLEFDRKDLAVPAGIERKFVVGEDMSTSLGTDSGSDTPQSQAESTIRRSDLYWRTISNAQGHVRGRGGRALTTVLFVRDLMTGSGESRLFVPSDPGALMRGDIVTGKIQESPYHIPPNAGNYAFAVFYSLLVAA